MSTPGFLSCSLACCSSAAASRSIRHAAASSLPVPASLYDLGRLHLNISVSASLTQLAASVERSDNRSSMAQVIPLATVATMPEIQALSVVAQPEHQRLPASVAPDGHSEILTLVASSARTTTSAVLSTRTELACILGLLLVVIAPRTRLAIYRAVRAVHQPANIWLLVHIAISFFELGRIQWRGLSGLPVHPTTFDLFLGLAHCLSSYQVLLLRTRAGYKDLIPLGLRIEPFLFRLCATIAAFACQSASLHRANIRLGMDSFLYTRLLIFVCKRCALFTTSPRTLHTSAAVLGGFIATHDSGFRGGLGAYVVFSAVSILCDAGTRKWMAGLSRVQDSPTKRSFRREDHTTQAPVRKLSSSLQRYIKIMLYIKAMTRGLQPRTIIQPSSSSSSSSSSSTSILPSRIRGFSEVGPRIPQVS